MTTLTVPLFLFATLLIVRLPLLMTDQPLAWRRMLALVVMRSVALALIGPWPAVASMVVAASLVDVIQVRLEAWFLSRGDAKSDRIAPSIRWVRLGSLLAHAALCIVMTSPRLRLDWLPWVGDAMQMLAREFPPLVGFVNMDHAAALVVLIGGLLCLNEANLLVLSGDYGALGLVLTAKGLARFKNLDDREFAEYFMVGTLVSLLTAGLVAEAVRRVTGPGS